MYTESLRSLPERFQTKSENRRFSMMMGDILDLDGFGVMMPLDLKRTGVTWSDWWRDGARTDEFLIGWSLLEMSEKCSETLQNVCKPNLKINDFRLFQVTSSQKLARHTKN